LPSYALTDFSLSPAAAPGADLSLGLTTSARPLVDRLEQAEGAAAAIPALTLSVGDGSDGSLVRHAFSRLSVSSFDENLSRPLSGTATLTGLPR